jgi:hypothetical protein
LPEGLIYNDAVMDRYSFEHWMLGRQLQLIRTAEERGRLSGWQPQARLADSLATQLRLLADRLDGRAAGPTLFSGSL